MTIEVGDILTSTGKTRLGVPLPLLDFTVTHVGKQHGIAVTEAGNEMSFHLTRILEDSLEWSVRKPLPTVSSHFYVIGMDGYDYGDDEDGTFTGYLEIQESLEEAQETLRLNPSGYSGIVRINPDGTWDHLTPQGDPIPWT